MANPFYPYRSYPQRTKTTFLVLNRAHPLARGLVLAAPFAESGTQMLDYSGYNTILNPIHGASADGSRFGKTMSFVSASDQYIDCGNPDQLNITGSMTIATCYRLDTTLASNATMQLVTKDSDVGGRAYTMDLHNSGGGSTSGARFYINGGSAPNEIDEGLLPLAGDDKTVVGGFNAAGPALFLWVNGSQIPNVTPNLGAIPSATCDVLIARRVFSTNTEPLNGQIRYVYIWNRALTVGEIRMVTIDPFGMFLPARRFYDPALTLVTSGDMLWPVMQFKPFSRPITY